MKRSIFFLLCLVASITIWLMSNLSKSNTDVVSVMVLVHSSIEGRREVASEPVPITASITASGFKLIALSREKAPVNVTVDPRYLVRKEGDIFTISTTGLYTYVTEFFGPQVSVRSFVSQNVSVRFQEEDFKKVPVNPVTVISYYPQYTNLGEFKVSPDSVLVYGEPSKLDLVEAVHTEPLHFSKVKNAIHGSAKLVVPNGMRTSQPEVRYFMDVTRYVELRSSVDISVRNLPRGRTFIISPSTAEVSYQVFFPISGETSFGGELYVDYNEFRNSLSGKCMIKVDGLPKDIIGYRIEPEFCDCIERR